jgi:hypothetical protein
MKRTFSILLCSLLMNTGLALAQTPYETLVTYRAQYPTPMSGLQAAALLNRVAWDFRDQGMKLLGKSGGENCPMPNGILISCDFLVHAPTLTGHDVMSGAQGGAGSVTGFTWGPGPEPLADSIASGARTLVDPIQPSNGGGVTPTPTPSPSPVPTPVTNGTFLNTQEIIRLANEIYKIQVEHEQAEAIERAKADAFRQAVGHEYQKFFTFVAKYILPAVGAVFVGRGLGK